MEALSNNEPSSALAQDITPGLTQGPRMIASYWLANVFPCSSDEFGPTACSAGGDFFMSHNGRSLDEVGLAF